MCIPSCSGVSYSGLLGMLTPPPRSGLGDVFVASSVARDRFFHSLWVASSVFRVVVRNGLPEEGPEVASELKVLENRGLLVLLTVRTGFKNIYL